MIEEIREKPNDEDIILKNNFSIAKKYLKEEYNRRHPKQVFWTMKNGEIINIKNMSEEHLLNTIKMIEKHEEDCEWFRNCGYFDMF